MDTPQNPTHQNPGPNSPIQTSRAAQQEIGETAIIASLLTFFLGFIGVAVGYAITRGKSMYEQSFGSLLLRSFLGMFVYSFVIVLILFGVGFMMLKDEGPRLDRMMDSCTTVPAGTEANNSTVISVNGKTCELNDRGEELAWDIFSPLLILLVPLALFCFYSVYVYIRFIIAAGNKTLYRPIVCLGGKDMMSQTDPTVAGNTNGHPFM